MDFNTLKNEIIKAPSSEPVFIFIGVGTMAGLLNDDGTLAQENYHQFPPFVQDLRNRVDNINLFLVLIDPLQENPPYLTRDFPVQEVATDHYKNQDRRLQVFVHRKVVYTEPDERKYYDENAVNITDILRDLNDFAVANSASLLYHDFTGRRTATLAEYFEHDYANVLDQIVYGMSARVNHGCYFDLSKSNAYFAIKLADPKPTVRKGVRACEAGRLAPVVKMFNYFKFILNAKYEKVSEEIKTYPDYLHLFIEEQKQNIIHDIRTEFKNVNIATLRQIKKILLNPDDDVDPNIYLYNGFNRYQRDMLLELLHIKEYNLLCEILFNICASQLEVLARLKNMDLSGEEILKFITADPDPYQWYKSIDGLLGTSLS